MNKIVKNKKYYLFFDLDYTISVADSPLSNNVVNAINSAQKNGHKVFINTGRALSCVKENILSPIKWDGIISGLGAHILINGKEVYNKSIPFEIIMNIATECFNRKQNCIFEGVEEVVKINATKDSLFTTKYLPETLTDFENIIKDLHFSKITFMGITPQWFYDKYNNYFTIVKHDTYEETAFKGYSKATGIEILKDILTFNIDETISFGDSNNDIEMLNYTHINVVMGQADHSLKGNASYVTDTFENDGVAGFIEKYLL